LGSKAVYINSFGSISGIFYSFNINIGLINFL